MSDKTTTGLTAATVAAATDLFYAVIGGNSRKIALSGAFNFGAVALGGAAIGTDAFAVTGTATALGMFIVGATGTGSGDFRIYAGPAGAANNNAALSYKANGSIIGYVGRLSSQFGIFDGAGAAVLLFGGQGTIGAWNSLVQFGGTSSSFPALKRSATILQARLADDSDFAPLQGRLRVHANAAAETPSATHTLRAFDAAGTEYKLLAVAA